jgi:uncharacterized protein DUF4388
MKTHFETAGDVRDVDLLAAFVAFWRDRTSGVVSFVRAGGTAAFSLAEGEVVSVSSSEPRFESAAILIRAGKLDADALERLGVPVGSDGALAALQAGILTKREWRWGEKIRAIEILADLLSWNDGKYYFDADARPAPGEFNLAIPRLLLELFLRSRDRHFVDHQLGHTNVPLVRSEEFDREFSTFGLTADAESVARLIDGTSTADEIAATAPADEFAVRKLLAALCTLGLVKPAEAAPKEPEAELAVPPAPSWDSVTTPLPPSALEMPPPREAGPEVEPDTERAAEPAYEEGPTLESAEPPVDEDAPLDEYRIADPHGRDAEAERATALEERGPAYDPIPSDPIPVREPVDVVPEDAPPRSRSGALLGGILAGLVLLIGAFLYFRSRPVSSGAAEPSTAATPATAATAPAPTAAVAAVPTAALPAAAAAPTPARAAAAAPARPAAKPTASSPRPSAPPPPIASAAKPEAPSAGRASWTSRAARDKKRLGSEKSTRYAIQLELACETPSLVEAWKHDRPAGSMWILATQHGGRDCFKVLWGRYPTLDAAKRGKAKMPSFFQTATNHPAVVRVK